MAAWLKGYSTFMIACSVNKQKRWQKEIPSLVPTVPDESCFRLFPVVYCSTKKHLTGHSIVFLTSKSFTNPRSKFCQVLQTAYVTSNLAIKVEGQIKHVWAKGGGGGKHVT